MTNNSWLDFRRRVLENGYSVPDEASDEARRAEKRSEATRIREAFIDAAINKAKSEGLEPGCRLRWDNPEFDSVVEADDIARDIIWPFRIASKSSLFFREDCSPKEVSEALSLSYNIPPDQLLSEARAGNRLNVDRDALEEAIGRYLSSDLRPEGIDRFLLTSLMDMEISHYLAHALDESRLIGESSLQKLLRLRSPFYSWFIVRLARLGVLVLFLAAWLWVGAELEFSGWLIFLIIIVALTLFLGDFLLSLAKLPSVISWHRELREELKESAIRLPDKLTGVYLEYHTAGPISVKRLRSCVEQLASDGVVWPSSLWALIDDIESRGGSVI